ncbi:uncharacterized protein LOC129299888 [Prosopis cineraria]|uniref:uncharacterized protein LOC129299888 n=1 Tax=Prosopis cineraria TaxID=364024 RepID=UPI0024108613|nr:uncharacterized protein LOC129299888 [Prosopis cineraria]
MSSPSPSFFSVFRSPKRSPKHTKDKLERDHAGPSIDMPEVEGVVFPSPPRVYDNRRVSDHQRREGGDGDGDGDGDVEVEEACRRFEKHLVEMIVEEGKTLKDLMEVEELLYYWKKLKCPVFVDLVCRFYGELCKDLFSSQTINERS